MHQGHIRTSFDQIPSTSMVMQRSRQQATCSHLSCCPARKRTSQCLMGTRLKSARENAYDYVPATTSTYQGCSVSPQLKKRTTTTERHTGRNLIAAHPQKPTSPGVIKRTITTTTTRRYTPREEPQQIVDGTVLKSSYDRTYSTRHVPTSAVQQITHVKESKRFNASSTPIQDSTISQKVHSYKELHSERESSTDGENTERQSTDRESTAKESSDTESITLESPSQKQAVFKQYSYEETTPQVELVAQQSCHLNSKKSLMNPLEDFEMDEAAKLSSDEESETSKSKSLEGYDLTEKTSSNIISYQDVDTSEHLTSKDSKNDAQNAPGEPETVDQSLYKVTSPPDMHSVKRSSFDKSKSDTAIPLQKYETIGPTTSKATATSDIYEYKQVLDNEGKKYITHALEEKRAHEKSYSYDESEINTILSATDSFVVPEYNTKNDEIDEIDEGAISLHESRREFSPIPLSRHRIVKEERCRHTRGKSQPNSIKEDEQDTKRRTKHKRKLPKTRSSNSWRKKPVVVKKESKANQTDELLPEKTSLEQLIPKTEISNHKQYKSAPPDPRKINSHKIHPSEEIHEIQESENEISTAEPIRKTYVTKNAAIRKRSELRRQESTISQSSDEEGKPRHERISADIIELTSEPAIVQDTEKNGKRTSYTTASRRSSDELRKEILINERCKVDRDFRANLEKERADHGLRSSVDPIIRHDLRNKTEALSKESLEIATLDTGVLEPQKLLNYLCKEGSKTGDEPFQLDESTKTSLSIPVQEGSESIEYRSQKSLEGSDEKVRSKITIKSDKSLLSGVNLRKQHAKISTDRNGIVNGKGCLTSSIAEVIRKDSSVPEKLMSKKSSSGSGNLEMDTSLTKQESKETPKKQSSASITDRTTVVCCPGCCSKEPYASAHLTCNDQTCPFLNSRLREIRNHKFDSSVRRGSMCCAGSYCRGHCLSRQQTCDDLTCPFLKSSLSENRKKKSDSSFQINKSSICSSGYYGRGHCASRQLTCDDLTCPFLMSSLSDTRKQKSKSSISKITHNEAVRRAWSKLESKPCHTRCPCAVQTTSTTTNDLLVQTTSTTTKDLFPEPVEKQTSMGPGGEGGSKTEVPKSKKSLKEKISHKIRSGNKKSSCKCECTCEVEGPKTKTPQMHTMWALTRVNIYEDASRTYEVMALQPKPSAKIQKTSEVVFVVLPNGHTINLPPTNDMTVQDKA